MLRFPGPRACVLVALGCSTPVVGRMSAGELAKTLKDEPQCGDRSS